MGERFQYYASRQLVNFGNERNKKTQRARKGKRAHQNFSIHWRTSIFYFLSHFYHFGLLRGNMGYFSFVGILKKKLPRPYLANNCPMSLNALNSKAFPAGSKKNMVACSPGSPLKRM